MAFDRKDGYLDDIPFKIASAFLPPASVALPAALIPDEELFFEKLQYDFSMEKKVLEGIKKEELKPACENNVSKMETMSNKLEKPNLEPVKPNVQNIFSLQSDILKPKPQKILDKVSNIDDQNNSKINLSDFENDTSSPFDYMELQTINDLEELSNVFQGLNNKYSSDDNVYKDKTSVSEDNEQNNVISNFSKSSSFPLQNSDGFESSEKYLTCPKEITTHGHDAWTASFSFPKENCFYPVSLNTKMDDLGFGSKEGLSRSSNSTVPKVPCLSSPSVKNNFVGNDFPVLASKSNLRGCKSFSDISNLSELSIENSTKQERSCTPPNDTFLDVETKLDSFKVHDRQESPSDVNCDNSSTKSELPDPYNELTEDGRKFVDAIADMGFPRAQVSRTVKHLGIDEKTVVEHLCQIQALEESGYDCLEAEAALHLHDYNQDQAKKFLDLIIKFQDLGFEKNAVKKALIQNKNDESRTIDALLS